MLKSPLTSVLKSIQSRFREAFDESGDDLKTCQNISFRLINRVLFSKICGIQIIYFFPTPVQLSISFWKKQKNHKSLNQICTSEYYFLVSDTLVPSMSFYSDFIQILSCFCPNFWKNLDKIWIKLEKNTLSRFFS